MKKGIEMRITALSKLPKIATKARVAPRRYVKESPGKILAGYLLKMKNAKSEAKTTKQIRAAIVLD